MTTSIATFNVDNFSRALGSGAGSAVVFFSASWCSPCQSMKPVFSELAERMRDRNIVFGTVDMAESPTIAQTYSIRSVPSIAVFCRGELIDVIAGQEPLDDVLGRVRRALSS